MGLSDGEQLTVFFCVVAICWAAVKIARIIVTKGKCP
jgi:hypothetical protein